MSSGLTRRRGAASSALNSADGDSSVNPSRTSSSNNVRDSGPETSYENGENGHKIAFDPRDISESAERSKQPKLTMMEEILLLGLKDKQVRPLAPPASSRSPKPTIPSPHARPPNADHNQHRDTSPSGTTTSHMLSEDASSSSSPSAAGSAWRRTRLGGACPWPTATLR